MTKRNYILKNLSMRNQKKQTTPINTHPGIDEMMTSIPQMYRNTASSLLVQYLQSNQDVKWGDQGHLYIGLQKVDNSHILDLIHDAMRLTKKAAIA